MTVTCSGIIGCGHYIPEKVLSNKDLAERFGKPESWFEERTGIRERRIVEKNVATSDLAILAAKDALKSAKILPEMLDVIIVATTTPDMIFPSTASLVQHGIGASNAAAFDISAACTGFVYAINIGFAYVTSGGCKNVLVIGADTYSKIVNDSDLNTSILFGDGAGAVVIGQVPEGYGNIISLMGTDGSGAELLNVPAGGSRTPITHENLDKRLNKIHMNGRAVFQFAIRILNNMIEQIIDQSRLSIEDISLIIPHQANMRVILAVSEKNKISMDKIYCNIESYGNMSSASIPVALSEAYKNGRLKNGDYILLAGFGAGLTWGANLIKWYE